MRLFRCRQFLVVFCLFLCFCLFSCGLEVFSMIRPPIDAVLPAEDTAEGKKCEFTTADGAESFGDIDQFGTAVFYRIYNNKSMLESDNNQIKSKNAEFSESGFNKMSDLHYYEMDSVNGNKPVFAKKGNNNLKAVIRLVDEGDYQSGFYLGTNANDLTKVGIPCRGIGGNSSFDNLQNLVGGGDTESSDFSYDPQSGTDVLYVNMYAVTYGINTSLTSVYSSLLYLGFLTLGNN